LGREVVRLRQKARLTQQELAQRSGVSLSLVRGVENGRNSPTLRSLEVGRHLPGRAPARVLGPPEHPLPEFRVLLAEETWRFFASQAP
jgi:DNA-binding XRE family transcriptional regulator